MPGIGSSQAGVIASNALKAKRQDFLTALGGINTSNIFFTFIAFFALEKTRSGAAAAVSQIIATPTLYDLVFIIIIVLITTLLASVLTLRIGKVMIRKIQGVSYSKLNLSIILFLTALVAIMTGLMGLLILIIGVCIGILAHLLRIKKSNMMGFFLLPTILYFSGLNPPLFAVLGI